MWSLFMVAFHHNGLKRVGISLWFLKRGGLIMVVCHQGGLKRHGC